MKGKKTETKAENSRIENKQIMFDNLRAIYYNGYFISKPEKKQLLFLTLPHKEILYGGAAGGGKSEALLMAALMYVNEQDYSALLLRKTYAELSLKGALMDRAFTWLYGTGARWKDERKTWIFPSGATLTFGYLDSENTKYRYQSSEFQFIGFDELTAFREDDYLYLFSRLRRKENSNIPLRMRAASNPGGIGHDWVKKRFVSPENIKSGRFIPATLEDNPYLDRKSYEENLNKLDLVTRRQLRHGDWEIMSTGNKFKREWIKLSNDYPQDFSKGVRFWDFAATEPKKGGDPDYTVGTLIVEKDGLYWVVDVQRIRGTPQKVEQLVRAIAASDYANYGNRVITAIEEEQGSSGKIVADNYTRNVLRGYTVKFVRPTGSKEVRANPVSAAFERGTIKIVGGNWNNAYVDELTAFPSAGVHDDQVDSTSGAYNMLSRTFALRQGRIEV